MARGDGGAPCPLVDPSSGSEPYGICDDLGLDREVGDRRGDRCGERPVIGVLVRAGTARRDRPRGAFDRAPDSLRQVGDAGERAVLETEELHELPGNSETTTCFDAFPLALLAEGRRGPGAAGVTTIGHDEDPHGRAGGPLARSPHRNPASRRRDAERRRAPNGARTHR